MSYSRYAECMLIHFYRKADRIPLTYWEFLLADKRKGNRFVPTGMGSTGGIM